MPEQLVGEQDATTWATTGEPVMEMPAFALQSQRVSAMTGVAALSWSGTLMFSLGRAPIASAWLLEILNRRIADRYVLPLFLMETCV